MEKQKSRERKKFERSKKTSSEGKPADKAQRSGKFVAVAVTTKSKRFEAVAFVAPDTVKLVAPSAKVIEKTIARATEVLGDYDGAMRWFGTPIRALDFATPIYVLKTKDGVDKINEVLGQMEHGTW